MVSTRALSRVSILRVALWCVLLAAITYTSTDPDLWGNVRFGLDILRDGSVPHTDAYSFTTDREWVNHEWLAEVFIGDAFRIGGSAGLILLKLAAVSSMLLLLGWIFRREGIDSPIVRDAAVAMALILTFDQIRYVRPQLFSLAAFAALLSCLTEAQRGVTRALLVLPFLFAVWANLHGGWLVGGGVLALWTLVTLMFGPRRHALWCAAAGAASLGATLLTPYGVELWTMLRETVGFDRSDIVEWQPIYALGWQSCLPWAATAAVGGAGLATARRRAASTNGLGASRCSRPRRSWSRGFRPSLRFPCFSCSRLRWDVRTRQFGTAPIPPASAGASPRARSLCRAHGGRPPPRGHQCDTSAHRSAMDPRTWRGRISERPACRTTRADLVRLGWIRALAPLAADAHLDGWASRNRVSPSLRDRHLRFYFDAPGGASLPTDLSADYVWIPERSLQCTVSMRRGGADCTRASSRSSFGRGPYLNRPLR